MTFERAFLYWLGLMAALISVAPKFVPPAIAGLLVFVIVGYVKKKLVFQWSWPATLLVALYVFYFVGTFFTHHRDLANHYIESKLSFVIFPLLLSFRMRQPMDFRPVTIGFAAGVLLTSILGLVHAFGVYSVTHDKLASFTAGNLSHLHHPTYFAVYLIVATALLWQGYRHRWEGFRLSWIVPLTIWFTIVFVLCLSLAGMLFLFGLLAALTLRFIYRRFGKKLLIGAIVVMPVLAVVLFFAVPRMQLQFGDASRYFLEYVNSPEQFIKAKTGYKEGNEVRLIMWTVTAQELAEHPLGVGTGNVDEHIWGRLEQYQMHSMVEAEYNPHNQYLQTGLEIGVQGLLILVFLLITGFHFAWKHRNLVLAILVASLAFNSLFESMLQRQSGIMFYSFWICLLIAWSHTNAKQTPQPDAGA